MITTSFNTFAQRYHAHGVTQIKSLTKIVDGVGQVWTGKHTRFEDDVGQVWTGKHTRFEDDVVERDVRKWHCGNGNGGGNPLPESGLSSAAARRLIYDEVIKKNRCHLGFVNNRPLEEQSRYTNQLMPFMANAQKGDIIYLHSSTLSQKGGALKSAVTHWGRYTGEKPAKVSHLCGFLESERDGGRGGLALSINVEEWFPVKSRFEGAGKQQTLYEVTDLPSYK